MARIMASSQKPAGVTCWHLIAGNAPNSATGFAGVVLGRNGFLGSVTSELAPTICDQASSLDIEVTHYEPDRLRPLSTVDQELETQVGRLRAGGKRADRDNPGQQG